MDIYKTVFRTVLDVHDAIYQRTDGRIGHRILGVPTLLLNMTEEARVVDAITAAASDAVNSPP